MAVINDPNVAANITKVGEVATGATGAAHITNKPIPTSVGHYTVGHRFAIVATQAADSRLFVIRNNHASNLIIPLRFRTKWINSAAHTAFIEDSLDAYKLTGFTVLDTTNTVTLTPSLKRTSMGATSAQIRGVTVAGAAAGMTGGTSTADSTPFAMHPRILNQAVEATTETTSRTADVMSLLDETSVSLHPFVLAQNEGIVLRNRVLLGAAAGSTVYVEFEYAEVTAY